MGYLEYDADGSQNGTVQISGSARKSVEFSPELIIQQQGCMDAVPLSGTQLLGRPAGSSVPDIVLTAPFVSRTHGTFITDESSVRYISHRSTNGTYYNDELIKEEEAILLRDGDLLYILSGDEIQDFTDISLVCAFTEHQKKYWHQIIRGQYDELTKLLNRKSFSLWFDSVRLLQGKENLCLYLLDIDHFKEINDTYGHAAGDAALTMLAQILDRAFEGVGKNGRWGGDEFVGVALLPMNQAVAMMDNIRREVGNTVLQGGFQMTISIGLIDIPKYAAKAGLKDIVSMVDEALYRSKSAGRNRITQYCPS